MKAGIVQLCSGDDPALNLPITIDLIRDAAGEGSDFVLTPEVTNCVSASRTRQMEVLQTEADDQTLRALRREAADLAIWLLIGSLALKRTGSGAPFVNRSFLVGPDGGIRARYDKIHMFDVTISETEAYHESRGYEPGREACLVETELGAIGMTICYDLRFPTLFRSLAQAGAGIITIPSAFACATGEAHWETLLRARAIECGAFVLAPAQSGTHPSSTQSVRKTHGHSLAVGPWGDILADGGEAVGTTIVDLNLELVSESRSRIPSLKNERAFQDM